MAITLCKEMVGSEASPCTKPPSLAQVSVADRKDTYGAHLPCFGRTGRGRSWAEAERSGRSRAESARRARNKPLPSGTHPSQEVSDPFSDLSTGHSSARASFIQRWAISSSNTRFAESKVPCAKRRHCRARSRCSSTVNCEGDSNRVPDAFSRERETHWRPIGSKR